MRRDRNDRRGEGRGEGLKAAAPPTATSAAPADSALAAAFAAIVAISLLAVGLALLSQHRFEMPPCPWCVLQRVQFVAIAGVALPGLLFSAPWVRRLSALAVALLALSGLAAALWQHFVAASSTSCNLTLADRIVGGLGLDSLWPEVFAAYASCADAAVKLFGLPYEFYSGALFLALVLAAAWLWRRAAG